MSGYRAFGRRLAAISTLLLILASQSPAVAVSQIPTFDDLMATYRHADALALVRGQLADLETRGLGESPDAARLLEQTLQVFLRQQWGRNEWGALTERLTRLREASGDHEGLVRALLLGFRLADVDQNVITGPPLADRAAAVASTLWPAGDPRLLEIQTAQGMGLYRRAEYDRALELLSEVEAAQARLVPDTLAHAGTLHALGLLNSTRRDYRAAITAAERSYAIRLRVGDELGAAGSAGLLSGIYTELGDYARARTLAERSIDARQRLLGSGFTGMGFTYESLAELHELLGDPAQAEEAYEQALRAFGASPRGSVTAARYGHMLTESGQLERARPLFARAMTTYETGSMAAPGVGVTLSYYANWLRRSGRAAEARRHAQAALDVRERNNLPLGLGYSLTQVAELAAEDGDFDAARRSYERALEVHERMAAEHPETNATRGGYAAILSRVGDYSRARELALDATDGGLTLIRLTLQGLPERQAVGYAANLRRHLELSLALLERVPNPGSTRQVFDRVIRSRAVVLDEVGRRQRTDVGRSPQATALADARARLAHLTIRGPAALGAAEFAQAIATARTDAERAETAFAAERVSLQEARQDQQVGIEDVARAVTTGSAMVAFTRYAALPGATDAASRYAAFVLTPGGHDPAFVPLGSAADIDAAIMATRDELLLEATAGGRGGRRTLASYRAAATRLRELVWDPIAGRIGDASLVMIVADGALHLVNFAALPVGGQRFLIESGPTLHYLATERDLLRQLPAPGQGMLAIGNPRFDGVSSGRSSQLRSANTFGNGCGDLTGLKFSPLPGSRAEVQAVASLWPRTRAGEVSVLTGETASESAFKLGTPGRRILHLATHGFFAGIRDCVPAAAPSPPVTVGDALLRSGLALAGANQRQSALDANDDGMLVAAEIASLDLTGVEWVVLSACDTGLGSIANGEGVFGLRRAFRIAGAATVIMTLWPVDDRATQTWVERLYRARLEGRQTTAEAVRVAGRGALDARRKAGQSDHPFYWGGFVAAGDWR